MKAKFRKKGRKAEPAKVAPKSKSILRRKQERQEKKRTKKQKRHQFYKERFNKEGADASPQPVDDRKRKKKVAAPIPAATKEEVHRQTEKQLKQLEREQKEQRKGRLIPPRRNLVVKIILGRFLGIQFLSSMERFSFTSFFFLWAARPKSLSELYALEDQPEWSM